MLKLIVFLCVLYLIEVKLIKNESLDYLCKKYFKKILFALLLLYGIVSALKFNLFGVILVIGIFYIFYKKGDTIIK